MPETPTQVAMIDYRHGDGEVAFRYLLTARPGPAGHVTVRVTGMGGPGTHPDGELTVPAADEAEAPRRARCSTATTPACAASWRP